MQNGIYIKMSLAQRQGMYTNGQNVCECQWELTPTALRISNLRSEVADIRKKQDLSINTQLNASTMYQVIDSHLLTLYTTSILHPFMCSYCTMACRTHLYKMSMVEYIQKATVHDAIYGLEAALIGNCGFHFVVSSQIGLFDKSVGIGKVIYDHHIRHQKDTYFEL